MSDFETLMFSPMPPLVVDESDVAWFLRGFEELSKSPESVIGFIETGFTPFECLLDHRSPNFFFGATLFK